MPLRPDSASISRANSQLALPALLALTLLFFFGVYLAFNRVFHLDSFGFRPFVFWIHFILPLYAIRKGKKLDFVFARFCKLGSLPLRLLPHIL